MNDTQKPPYPVCFESQAQYRDWKELAVNSGLRSLNICVDCSPEYQAKMVAADRCHSPGVNVTLLQLREKENDLHQEVIEAKASELEAFNDAWMRLVDRLTYVPPPVEKKPRKKKKQDGQPT
jgi:hypothetical protein